MNNKLLLLTMMIGANCLICSAQSNSYTLNSAGGSATISGNTHDWSVGEMVLVNTASTTSLIVTQGLLQPTIQNVGIKDVELNATQLAVFPNPTEDFLMVQSKLPANAQFDISVYDLTGRLFERKEHTLISENEVQKIDFRPYSGGIYMLEVNTTINGKAYKNTFKIQNNK